MLRYELQVLSGAWQRVSSGQAAHLGLRASHIWRPWWMISWEYWIQRS